MKLESHGGSAPRQQAAAPIGGTFAAPPVRNFAQAVLASPAATKLPDRSGLNRRRQTVIVNAAARSRLPILRRSLPPRPALAKRQPRYPSLTVPPYTAAPLAPRAVDLRHHPEVNGRVAAATIIDPWRFADHCAGPGSCDPLDHALARAMQMPGADPLTLATRLDLIIARSRMRSLAADGALPARRDIASADLCRSFLSSRLDFFACLGLPSDTIKKEMGSPMFKRVGLIPRGGGRYHLGKPYRIGGDWYYPREVPDYDAIGLASWYGHRFHRRMTANGEWFDMEYFTAAHPTLPLPSYARVVNLENGKELVVRINDRGPFIGSRLIDLSKKTAESLGFRTRGIAMVRVQYIGPAPLNDNGRHLAAMNRELQRKTPLAEMIAYASGLRRQAMVAAAALSTGIPAKAF